MVNTATTDPVATPIDMRTVRAVARANPAAPVSSGSEERPRAMEQGFTLVELILAIVLVGILSAVAIVGLSGITKTSDKSQCSSLLSAAQSAAASYYANAGYYPKTSSTTPVGFDEMMTSSSRSPAVLTLPAGVNHAGVVMSTSKWSITIGNGGTPSPNGFTKTSGGGAACS